MGNVASSCKIMLASPKVSVIVAVFQAVKTLRRCLDSIKNQTMTEWECLLVDDGSSDGSGKMCDEYAVQMHVSGLFTNQTKGWPLHARQE